MAAQKHRQRQIEETVLVLEYQPPVLLVHLPVLVGDEKRSARRLACTLDLTARLVGLSADDAGNSGLHNAGLLMGDRRQRITEMLLMIVVDGRNDGKRRSCHHIGSIEASAEADFEEHIVGSLTGESEECRRRRDLEEGDGLAAICHLALLEQAGKMAL